MTDTLTTEAATELVNEPSTAAVAWSRRLVGLGALAVAGALVLVAVLLGVQARREAARADTRHEVLQAAGQAAVNLTTINYRTAERDLARILDGSTGALRAQFEKQKGQFPAVLAREKSVSTGGVLASALDSLSGSRAVVLVAVDARVSNAASAQAGGQPVVKHYRMVMRLQRVHARWLVDDVAFAGLPQ